MRKLLALVATMAMVLSMFTGIAFAANEAAAAAYIKEDGTTASSSVAGDTTVVKLTASADENIASIVLDFTNSNFTYLGMKAAGSFNVDVNGKVITLTKTAAAASETVYLLVINPSTMGTHDLAAVTVNGASVTAPTLKTTYKVTLDQSYLVWGGNVTVSGTISEAGKVPAGTVYFEVVAKDAADADVVMASGYSFNGVFSTTFKADIANNDEPKEQNYEVRFKKNANGGPIAVADTVATVPVKLNVVVNFNPTSIKGGDSVIVTGTVTDGAGNPVVGHQMYVKVNGTNQATPVTASNGQFAAAVTVAGVAPVTVTGPVATYATLNVETRTLNIDKSVDSVVHSVDPVSIKFRASTTNTDGTKVYRNGATIVIEGVKVLVSADANVLTQGFNADKSVKTADNLYYTKLVYENATANVGGEDGVFNWTGKFVEAGTVAVSGSWEDAGDGENNATYPDYVGSTTVSVVAPAAINVGGIPTSVPAGATSNLSISVKDALGKAADGAGANPFKNITISTAGPLPTSEQGVRIDKSTAAGPYAVALNPLQEGTITVTITVEYDNGAIETVTREIAVTGLKLSANVAGMVFGDKDITLVLNITAAGQPVNNATVVIGGTNFTYVNAAGATVAGPATIAPANYNINNGVYTLIIKEVKDVADLTITATAGTSYGTMTVPVDGKTAYTVTTDKATLLGGKAEDVLVTITDASGNVVNNIPVASVTIDGTNVVDQVAQLVDTNNDGIQDAYKVNVIANADGNGKVTDKATVNVSYDNGKYVGKLELAVVKPLVTLNVEKITDSVEEWVTVKVTDPRDGSDLTITQLNVTGAGLEASFDLDDKDGNTPVLTNNDEFEFFVFADDKVEDPAVAPEVIFTVVLGGQNIEAKRVAVVPATLTVTPDKGYIGHSNEFEVSLVDANGKAMKDVTILFAGTNIGKTNDAGVITYAYTPASSSNITVTADLAGTDLVKTVSAVNDTEKPVVDLTNTPGTSETAAFVVKGTFTDNIAVTRIYINNVEIPFIADLGEFEYDVTLALGANTIRVFAFDAAGNGTIVSKTVTYAPAAPKAVTLQGTSVQRKGENLFVQIRQFEELGAALKWDAATKTATFTVGDTTVKVTVGSTTATVNGVAKTMPAAPFLSNGRTMVPTRFIAEELGWDVKWVPGDIVTITLP